MQAASASSHLFNSRRCGISATVPRSACPGRPTKRNQPLTKGKTGDGGSCGVLPSLRSWLCPCSFCRSYGSIGEYSPRGVRNDDSGTTLPSQPPFNGSNRLPVAGMTRKLCSACISGSIVPNSANGLRWLRRPSLLHGTRSLRSQPRRCLSDALDAENPRLMSRSVATSLDLCIASRSAFMTAIENPSKTVVPSHRSTQGKRERIRKRESLKLGEAGELQTGSLVDKYTRSAGKTMSTQ
jgi:hypothetical protein